MSRFAFPVGLLASALIAALSVRAWAAEPPVEGKGASEERGVTAQKDGAPAGDDKEDKDKATDKEHLLAIWKAIMAYKKDHGQVPDYLSDLVPEYLPDKAVLLSPVKNGKRQGASDPKLRSSYSYEFSAQPYGRGKTFRELKETQMKEFGPVVPILRCFAHQAVMNVSYSGDYFESELFWEKSPAAAELRKKLGGAAGFDEGEFTEMRVVDGASGEPVADAEVRLTHRQYHFLPLPDRTLKTDAEGKVRVPLGPAEPPSRALTVAVAKSGYASLPEVWREGSLPNEKTWRLSEAATIGGRVKDHDSAPLAGAQVLVYATTGIEGAPEELPAEAVGAVGAGGRSRAASGQPLDTCVTDQDGRWRCALVPKDFTTLTLRVEHPTSWRANYRCVNEDAEVNPPRTGTAGAKTVERGALLGESAEFQLEAVPVLSGVLLSPDGKPLAGEVITIAPAPAGDSTPRRAKKGEDAGKKVTTDSAGRFSMTIPEPGDVTVSAAPKNLAMVMRAVTPAPGMEPVELKASKPRRIAGQVRDDDGKPVAGVRVTFIGWAEAAVSKQVAVTNAQGEFAWDAAPGDQIGLTFHANGFAQSTEWVAGDKKDTLVVELRRQ